MRLTSRKKRSTIAVVLFHDFAIEIVVDGLVAAKPAKEATADIPIVFTLATDPVADGLVASMARPGGNLTGLTLSVGYELVAKRVELLKDIKPDLARLAILRNPANPTAGSYLSEAEKAGRAPRPYDADRSMLEARAI
jgi:putative ABC transport system substrate-binding protein